MKAGSDRVDWMKLQTDKEVFFGIVNALNRYYDAIKGIESTDSRSFRRKLAASNPEQTEIYFQKFGDYEYLVFARITQNGKSESDSWIHIDGISMERDELRAKGAKNHPAFEIKCLQDLFEESCVLASEEEEESIQEENRKK